MNDRVQQVVHAIGQVAGNPPAALHEPDIGDDEQRLVRDCLRSTFVSSVGEYVDRFEEEIARLTGCPHAVATVNGTAALHLALVGLGIGPGDEVIVPGISFIATANAVFHAGAVPHFVDVEAGHLSMDAAKLRRYLRDICGPEESGGCRNRHTGRRIAAMIPVHVFGHVAHMPALMDVAAEFGLTVLEDAAEALGSTRYGKSAGSFGECGIFSFNGNKIITCGGGGMIVTGNSALARRLKHLSTTAKIPHPWRYEHDMTAFNYRLPNLNAALGVAQLRRLDAFVSAKRALFARYRQALAGIEGVRLMAEPDGARSNYWLQALVLDDPHDPDMDDLLEALNTQGYGARPLWSPLHLQRHCRDCPRMPDMSVAEDMARRVLNPPSSAHLVQLHTRDGRT